LKKNSHYYNPKTHEVKVVSYYYDKTYKTDMSYSYSYIDKTKERKKPQVTSYYSPKPTPTPKKKKTTPKKPSSYKKPANKVPASYYPSSYSPYNSPIMDRKMNSICYKGIDRFEKGVSNTW